MLFLILQETDNGKKPFTMSYTDMEKALGLTRKQVRNAMRTLQDNEIVKGTVEGTLRGTPQAFVTLYKLTACNAQKIGEGTLRGTLRGTPKPTPFEGENLTDEQKRYNGWLKFCKEKCPYITANITQLDFGQFTKLRERYGSQMLSEVIQQIENRKDLRKRYSSLYLTMINWCKNAQQKNE